MSDIGGIGNFANDPFAASLQRQQGDPALEQQQQAQEQARQRAQEALGLSESGSRICVNANGTKSWNGRVPASVKKRSIAKGIRPACVNCRTRRRRSIRRAFSESVEGRPRKTSLGPAPGRIKSV